MQITAIMSILWGIALTAFVALMIYRGHLEQHEAPELFLDDNADGSLRKREHDEIVRRVKRIQPFCTTTGSAAAALTVLLLGVEVFRALPYVRF